MSASTLSAAATRTVLVALLFCTRPALAADTDIVVFTNGDRLSGEVKSLERGQLRFKTTHAGDVYIEWDKIRRVDSISQFDVETISGQRLIGRPMGKGHDGRLYIAGAADSSGLSFDSVVRMTALKNTFWGRVDGSIDVGSSFALANHLAQLNAAVTAKYRAHKYSVGSDANSTIIHQDNVPDTQRGTIGLSYARFFGNRWQSQAAARVERNEQLGLDLRASSGVGIGRYLAQSNTTLFDAMTAISVNREQRSDGTSAYNLEGVLSTAYSKFVYDTPKANIDAWLHLYPSLSDWGRLRFEASAIAKRETVKDLFLGLNAVESYDNQPPEGVTNTDWNVYLSVGWTF
jgi:hypothetical protein